MFENVFYDHTIIRILLHDSKDKALCLIRNIYVFGKFHLVLYLHNTYATILLRSSYE